VKPTFAVLLRHYPKKKDVTHEELFKELGWDELINNFNFTNTCAVRVSLALVKSGMPIPGRMKVEAGAYKGRRIETGQALLSRALAHKSLLGPPERYRDGKAAGAIGSRSGIVSFWRLNPAIGDTQGHIDIVSPATGGIQACGTACYWGAGEVWFWPIR